MAKALQCPECGRKTPLSGVGGGKTFRCAGCGRALKIPAELRPAASGGRRPSTRSAPSPPPDAARTSVLPTAGAAAAPAPTPTAPRRRRAQPPPPPKVGLALRVLAWVIAVPVGAVAVWYPARKFGFLSGQRLLDVLVGSGWGRYGRVLLIAPAWALVTTLIVQLLLLLFRRMAKRRETIRSERAGAPPPPGRDGRGSGRSQGSRRATSRRPS